MKFPKEISPQNKDRCKILHPVLLSLKLSTINELFHYIKRIEKENLIFLMKEKVYEPYSKYSFAEISAIISSCDTK